MKLADVNKDGAIEAEEFYQFNWAHLLQKLDDYVKERAREEEARLAKEKREKEEQLAKEKREKEDQLAKQESDRAAAVARFEAQLNEYEALREWIAYNKTDGTYMYITKRLLEPLSCWHCHICIIQPTEQKSP